MVGAAKKTKPKGKAHRKAAAKVKKTCKVVTRKVHGRKKRVKVCTPVKAKKRPAARKPAAKKPAAAIGARAPAAAIVAPATVPAASQAPVPVVTATATDRAMERLLWRAGFGPAPGQAAQL